MSALRPADVRRFAATAPARRFGGGGAVRRLAPAAPVVLRIVLGAIIAAHGWQKLDGGVVAVSSTLAGRGIPGAELVAWSITLTELVGGVALVFGLATRVVAATLGALLIGSAVLLKAEVGFIVANATGAELELALLGGVTAVLLLGPGRPSVDHLLGLEVGVPAVGVSDAIRR